VSNKLKPWERRPDESNPAWEAFASYRDMGSARSGAKVAKSLGKSIQLINGWSAKYDWVERSRAFDRHEDAVQVEAYKDQTKKIVRQQTQLADKLLRHLDKTLDSNIKYGTDPSIRWTTAFTAATKVQGGAMDMVKDKSDQTTDTVRAIERIIERLTQDPEGDG
jgi:hypothetical protein